MVKNARQDLPFSWRPQLIALLDLLLHSCAYEGSIQLLKKNMDRELEEETLMLPIILMACKERLGHGHICSPCESHNS